MLCGFLPSNSVSQPQVYMCPLLLELSAAPHPSPPLLAVTDRGAELPVFHSSFPLAVCFTHGNVCVSTLLSQPGPPSPSHAVSTSLFSVCVSIAALQIGSSVPFFYIP